MKRALLPVSLVLLAACARGPGGATDSGVTGVVLAGPQCPVMIEGSPCPDVPWVGTVRAVSADGEAEVATDDRGQFRMGLEPGAYTMQAVTDGGPPSGIPLQVVVPDGEFVEVTLEVDTGIR
ncbi:MAG TPA: hypothetical protein VJN50_09625 [Actinomycetota bacterium]|nr:hypothetical protein [Actinomycetota bacterium]